MTIVKVQRPVMTYDPENPWLIYDQYRARECQIPQKQIPTGIVMVMNSRPGQRAYKSYFIDAVWDIHTKTWDLSRAILTEDKGW